MKKTVEKMMADWEYKKAVDETKPLIIDWGKKTLVVARALFVAREKLSNSGARTDLTLSQMRQGADSTNIEQPRTFEQFCFDVGVPRPTAYRWLACYDPDEDYLFEVEEAKEKTKAELDGLFEKVRKKRVTEPSYVPDDSELELKWNRNLKSWTTTVETKFQNWLYLMGYKEFSDKVLDQPEMPMTSLSQFGLFGTDYLSELGVACQKQTTGSGGQRYFEMVEKYKPRIPKNIEPNRIMRVPVIVDVVLSGLEVNERRQVALLLSDIIKEENL